MKKSIIVSRFNEDINWLKQLKDFKKISVSEDAFDENISLENNKKIEILPAVNNFKWNDIHFNAKGNRIIAQKLLKEF